MPASIQKPEPPVVIAQLGCGYWGPNLLRNFATLPQCRVKWVADPSLAARNFVESKFPSVRTTASWEQVIADPEVRAVVIATPAATHHQYVKAALEAGKDVLVEKPMALRRAEGEELVTLAAKHNRVLMVGHVLQYHPAVTKLKSLIAEGTLGKIQYIYSNRLNIGKIRVEENILWSYAPHDVSVMLMLLDELPVTISAHGGTYLNHGVPDVTMSVFNFASGVRGHIFVNWLHPYKEQRLVVVGDRKMVVFNDAAPTEKLISYAHRVEWINRRPVAQKAESEVIAYEEEEPLRIECAHFLDCVLTRNTPRTDGREGLAVLSVLEACQQSLDNNGATIAFGGK
jgi:UDP-2-acetamido-3-amino-2,3-dideoxy-glucuronate N-acetyltransferase